MHTNQRRFLSPVRRKIQRNVHGRLGHFPISEKRIGIVVGTSAARLAIGDFNLKALAPVFALKRVDFIYVTRLEAQARDKRAFTAVPHHVAHA